MYFFIYLIIFLKLLCNSVLFIIFLLIISFYPVFVFTFIFYIVFNSKRLEFSLRVTPLSTFSCFTIQSIYVRQPADLFFNKEKSHKKNHFQRVYSYSSSGNGSILFSIFYFPLIQVHLIF